MTYESLDTLTRTLKSGQSLTRKETTAAAELLIAPATPEVAKKDFLRALNTKGETAQELAAFAITFRQRARNPQVEPFAPHAIDICGTGGDGAGSFNISTAVGFIAATAGVPVFKHGNRSITSRCGSADLLSALGFPLDMEATAWRKSLQTLNFAFFFAPAYHPAFAHIAPIRKALAAEGTRTIFNLLGPILNPGTPAHQIVGVFHKKWVEPIAEALHQLGLKRGLVVHGVLPNGSPIDELTCSGKNYIAGVGELRHIYGTRTPSDFGLQDGDPDDLRGGSFEENRHLLDRLLDGNGPPGLETALCMNAGAALWAANAATSLAQGATYARELLHNGAVASWLSKAQSFFKTIAPSEQKATDRPPHKETSIKDIESHKAPMKKDTPLYIPWSQLTPDTIQSTIETALAKAQSRIDAIARQDTTSLTYTNTLEALEHARETLSQDWRNVQHLENVLNSTTLRTTYNTLLPKISEFSTRLFLNTHLWTVLKSFAATDEARALTGARRRFLTETMADFLEHGADLPPEKRQRLITLNATLAQATQKYSENVLDATNAWELIIEDEAQLAGLPASARDAARQSALEKDPSYAEKNAWRFTLHQPSYSVLMQHLDDNTLRRKAWQAATAIGRDAPYDNTGKILEILRLRREKAQLLGKKHFADYILERRMAKNGASALHFVENLHNHIQDTFKKEWQALENFKADTLQQPLTPLEPWEVAYWSEKQRQIQHAFDEETLRPYFPIDGVVRGMFAITEQLFGIQITPLPTVCLTHEAKTNPQAHPTSDTVNTAAPSTDAAAVEVWHPDVNAYTLHDRDGRHLGSFYTDWHPRASKRSGAWMTHLITGGPQPNGTFAPHLGLICGNLTPPLDDRPALLTHYEVQTIFHEFGHLLHHLLGEVEVRSLNGIHVAWDFVELPSQIMENWCWERESLDIFARHYQTSEPLPEPLFQKLRRARQFHAAIRTMRQLSFGKMDLALHIHLDPTTAQPDRLDTFIEKSLHTYRPTYTTPPRSNIRHFHHLFSDPTGYAAGYYSYKWAEVLDADAFTLFKEKGILNPQVGAALRQKILSKGNSAPPEQLYRDFMGRGADPNALLARDGLLDT